MRNYPVTFLLSRKKSILLDILCQLKLILFDKYFKNILIAIMKSVQIVLAIVSPLDKNVILLSLDKSIQFINTSDDENFT